MLNIKFNVNDNVGHHFYISNWQITLVYVVIQDRKYFKKEQEIYEGYWSHHKKEDRFHIASDEVECCILPEKIFDHKIK